MDNNHISEKEEELSILQNKYQKEELDFYAELSRILLNDTNLYPFKLTNYLNDIIDDWKNDDISNIKTFRETIKTTLEFIVKY